MKENTVFRIIAKEDGRVLVNETFNAYEVSLPMTYEDFLKCDTEEKPRRTFPTVIADPDKRRLECADSSFRFDTCEDKTCVIETKMYKFTSQNVTRSVEVNIIYFSNMDQKDPESTNNALFVRSIYKYNAESIVDMIMDTISVVYTPSKIFDNNTFKYFSGSDMCSYNGASYVNIAKLRSVEKQLNESLERNSNLEENNRSLSQNLNNIMSENVDIKIQKQNMAEEIERLNIELKKAQSNPVDTSTVVQDGADNLTYKGISYIKYDKYSRMTKDFTTQIDSLNKDKENLTKSIDRMNNDHTKEVVKLNTKINQLTATRSLSDVELINKMNALEKEHDQDKAIIAELEEAINGDPEKVSPMVVNDLRKQIESLESKLNKTTNDNKELAEKNSILQQWYDEYSAEEEGGSEVTENDLEAMDVIIEQKQKAIERAYATLEELDEKIASKRAELRSVSRTANVESRNNIVSEATSIASNTKKETTVSNGSKRKYTKRTSEEVEHEMLVKEASREVRKRLGLGNRANLKKAISNCDPKILEGIDLTLIK